MPTLERKKGEAQSPPLSYYYGRDHGKTTFIVPSIRHSCSVNKASHLTLLPSCDNLLSMSFPPSTTNNKMHNIVLIGFMGCGKSTVGRELHKKLGYHFIDTDQVIEKQTGISIPEIFKQDGEEAFRELETNVLKEIIHQKTNHHIIATGGGMPIRDENQPLIKQLGFTVLLSCSPQKILERTSKNANRPLLNGPNPLEKIISILNQRSPIYKKSSHIEINTSSLDLNEISCGILESARYHFGTMPQSL